MTAPIHILPNCTKFISSSMYCRVIGKRRTVFFQAQILRGVAPRAAILALSPGDLTRVFLTSVAATSAGTPSRNSAMNPQQHMARPPYGMPQQGYPQQQQQYAVYQQQQQQQQAYGRMYAQQPITPQQQQQWMAGARPQQQTPQFAAGNQYWRQPGYAPRPGVQQAYPQQQPYARPPNGYPQQQPAYAPQQPRPTMPASSFGGAVAQTPPRPTSYGAAPPAQQTMPSSAFGAMSVAPAQQTPTMPVFGGVSAAPAQQTSSVAAAATAAPQQIPSMAAASFGAAASQQTPSMEASSLGAVAPQQTPPRPMAAQLGTPFASAQTPASKAPVFGEAQAAPAGIDDATRQLFARTDSAGSGSVAGKDAFELFSKSDLARDVSMSRFSSYGSQRCSRVSGI